MEVVKAIFRGFSYVYHALLALFLLSVSGIALGTAPNSLNLDMLPWTGPTLAKVVFFGSLFALITVVLAFLGKLRPLFFLWSLAVVVLMFRGFFFSGFRFNPGSGGPKTAGYLVVGALIALPGAWWRMTQRMEKRRY